VLIRHGSSPIVLSESSGSTPLDRKEKSAPIFENEEPEG